MDFLKIENLEKYYTNRNGIFLREEEKLYAVNGVSLSLNKGEILGLVGESGCGKSTLARLILKLEKASKGKIFFKGKDMTDLRGDELKKIRKSMQIIFQDSYSSLNPRQTVGDIISEPLKNFEEKVKIERFAKVKELMDIVGLNPDHISRYPHEFSGGQCQRINIARALALYPELIVCDEPISSLDVSIQAQILNLLKHLKSEFELSYIFISHDLSAVSYISDRIAVMYLGKIVEVFENNDLEKKRHHPYTKILLEAVPIANPLIKNKWENIYNGEDIHFPRLSEGCSFYPRCPFAKEICRIKEPALKAIEEGHLIACWIEGIGGGLTIKL